MRPLTSRHSSPLTVVPQQCVKEVKSAEECPASLVGDAELLASAVSIHPTSSDLEDARGIRGGEERPRPKCKAEKYICYVSPSLLG